jgi:hypothetical protein
MISKQEKNRMVKKIMIALSVVLLSVSLFAVNPTGDVTLYLDVADTNHQIYTTHLYDGPLTVTTSANTSGYSVGQHVLLATYSGDSGFASASAQTTITIDSPLTGITMTLAASPSETKAGQPIAVTITLTPQ